MRKLVVFMTVAIATQGGLIAGGCSDGPQKPLVDKDQIARGTIKMDLETVSDSGKVYRLRNAVFPVDSTGVVVIGGGGFFSGVPAPPIFSTDAGSAGGIVEAGGAASTGGAFPATGGDIFGTGGGIFGTGGTVGGTHTIVLNSEDDPSKTVLEAFLNPGSYEIQLLDGWFVEQVDQLLGTSAAVQADLVSSPVQFFDITSDAETFVKFDFDVDGQRVTFGPPGRLIVGIGVHERNGGACGNGVIDPGESCDGFDLGGETCASVTLGSLPNGTLLCSQFCSFDTTFCFGGGTGGGGGAGGMFDGGVGGSGGTFGGPDAGPGGFGGFGFDGGSPGGFAGADTGGASQGGAAGSAGSGTGGKKPGKGGRGPN